MKNAFAIVTLTASLAALLSACATPQQAPSVPLAAAASEAAPAAVAGPAAPAAPVQDELPSVPLSGDLLYQLTRAEFEFRRGQWQGPYVALMGAAQQTRDPRIAHRAAEMALAARQVGEALAAIRLWRELAPHSDEATQYFLGFVVLGDSLDEAEPIFRARLQDAAPAARGVTMFQTQQFLIRARDKAAALAMLERLLAPYDEAPEAHLALAQSAFAIGNGARALQEAQRAALIAPDSELAALTLAQAQSGSDPLAASAVLTTFLARNPGAREVRGAYVRMLIEQKQYEAARQQFLVLLKEQPDHLPTLYALGVMSMQMNDPAAAETYLKHFLDVLALHPDDERDPSKVLMLLSQIAEQRADIDAALAWLDKVDGTESGPYFSARIARAQLMARHGDGDGARKVLADLKSGDAGEQVRVLQAEAQLLGDSGDGAGAFGVLEGAVARFPENTELRYNFALAAEKTGRFELMETSLRDVIARDPGSRHAYNALGYSLAERNVRLPEARALIAQALTMAPDDPFIIDSMGWVQFRLGDLAQAEQLLRRAYGLRDDPEIAIHLGEVLWQKGDQTGARALWREAQARDPNNEALKSMLARLKLSL